LETRARGVGNLTSKSEDHEKYSRTNRTGK
jgi:hypothetical protein